MTGEVITGRQRPEPGSGRDVMARNLKAWLLAHPTGGMYWQIAAAMGIHTRRIHEAVLDIQLFDPDLIISVPAPRNGYTVRLTWREVLQGEANQCRHNATRLDRQAIRFDKEATQFDRLADHAMAGWLRSAADAMRAQAAQLRSLAEAFDR